MSAVPQPRQPLLLPMSLLHLDAVMAIEAGAYPFPWTHGNFVDSLAAGYDEDWPVNAIGLDHLTWASTGTGASVETY